MEGVLLRVSAAVAALIVIGGAAGALAQTSPTDARSCAVRFRAVQNMFSYDFDNPRSLATSKAYGERAKAVLAKAGMMAASAADLPKDVSDAGAAYNKSFMDNVISSAQVTREVRACDAAHGFPSLV
jgi:hypothetical protein